MKQDDRGTVDESKDIQKEIDRWKGGLIIVAVFLLVAYAMAFFSIKNFPASLDAEKWGQFGDFMGGLMNPLVAFAAFFWLTQSVKLQKKELAETRSELASSVAAQRAMAENGDLAVRVAAITALVNSIESQLKNLEDRFRELPRLQASVAAHNSYEFRKQLSEEFEETRKKIEELKESREKYYGELRDFLSKQVQLTRSS